MDAKNSPFLTRLDAVAAETETLLNQLLATKPIAGELGLLKGSGEVSQEAN